MKFKLVNKKYFLTLLAVLAVMLIFVVIRQNLSTLKDKSVENSEPTPTETKYLVDDVNDGVYTNYKYGYRIKYPKDMFEQTYSDGDSAGWDLTDSSEQKVERPIKLYITELNYLRDIYELLYSKNRMDIKAAKSTITKLSTEEKNGLKIMRTLSITDPEILTEHAVSYEVVWLREDKPMIVISLSAAGRDGNILVPFKNLFEQISESFEFTD